MVWATTKLLIYRGDRPSASAFALRQALVEAGANVNINTRGQTRSWRRKIINWGSTNVDLQATLNPSENVGWAVDKIITLEALGEGGVRVPQWWTTTTGVPTDQTILARSCLNCSSGAGITIVRSGEPMPTAPLYVQYVKKSAEYRVHVFKGKTIFVQQKRKKENVTQTSLQSLIRSHANGWVFAENNVTFKDQEQESCTKAMAVRAVELLGLDFGAVDVIIGKKDGLPYILEVNTAPGLQSTRLTSAYVNAIKEWADG